MSINVEAYIAEYKARMAELDGLFRATIREKHGRDLNAVEEAQVRAGVIQTAIAEYLVREFQAETEPEAVVVAIGISVAGGILNLANQYDVELVACCNLFSSRFIAAIQADAMGLGVYIDVPADPFEQH